MFHKVNMVFKRVATCAEYTYTPTFTPVYVDANSTEAMNLGKEKGLSKPKGNLPIVCAWPGWG